MSIQGIYNYRPVDDQTATAGQPTEEQLEEAANEGFRTVINLATLDDRGALADEAGLVRSLGMAYHHIPVVWSNPTKEDFAAFEEAMSQAAGSKTLIHCAANFRVTAFYSLYASQAPGMVGSAGRCVPGIDLAGQRPPYLGAICPAHESRDRGLARWRGWRNKSIMRRSSRRGDCGRGGSRSLRNMYGGGEAYLGNHEELAAEKDQLCLRR